MALTRRSRLTVLTIRAHGGVDADLLKGFVVVESDVELDVVAVYAAAGQDDQVETLHTERVPPRRANP